MDWRDYIIYAILFLKRQNLLKIKSLHKTNKDRQHRNYKAKYVVYRRNTKIKFIHHTRNASNAHSTTHFSTHSLWLVKIHMGHIYKKMSQLLWCSYCLKDIFTPHLMILFLMLVGIFNVSQFFIRVYL